MGAVGTAVEGVAVAETAAVGAAAAGTAVAGAAVGTAAVVDAGALGIVVVAVAVGAGAGAVDNSGNSVAAHQGLPSAGIAEIYYTAARQQRTKTATFYSVNVNL